MTKHHECQVIKLSILLEDKNTIKEITTKCLFKLSL